MSTAHLDVIEKMVAGSPAIIPRREILMLPNRLHLSNDPYNPCEFGTPGGAPRLLGPEFPVVVSGPYTYIYVQIGHDKTPVYVRLEEPPR